MPVLLAALMLVGFRTPAAAYGRESLGASSTGPCVEMPGVPDLFWSRGCLTQTFNDQLFSVLDLLSEGEVRDAFSAAFATWAAVDCDGRKPFSVQQASGVTKTSTAEFLHDSVNEAIVVARTREQWADLEDHDSAALAITSLWHNKNTGEILDVDMELNLGIGPINDCVKYSCTGAMVDLQNTITHEGGHLLGLGHSAVANTTMSAENTVAHQTSKRTLASDDKSGYCALDLPPYDCTGSACVCPPPPIIPTHTAGSCGCRIAGQAHTDASWFVLGASVFALRWVRRRKRQHQFS
jgi:hypothetical protein